MNTLFAYLFEMDAKNKKLNPMICDTCFRFKLPM
jgi:hypothetical protein